MTMRTAVRPSPPRRWARPCASWVEGGRVKVTPTTLPGGLREMSAPSRLSWAAAASSRAWTALLPRSWGVAAASHAVRASWVAWRAGLTAAAAAWSWAAWVAWRSCRARAPASRTSTEPAAGRSAMRAE